MEGFGIRLVRLVQIGTKTVPVLNMFGTKEPGTVVLGTPVYRESALVVCGEFSFSLDQCDRNLRA